MEMNNVKQMKNKPIKYKNCNSTIAQLISSEELISVYNLKAALERKERRAERYENMLKHKQPLYISGFYYIYK